MILSLTGETGLSLRNFQPDTAVTGSKMRSAELVIDDVATTCIIRNIAYGNIETLSEKKGNISILIFNRIRHTAHTRKGFVDVQITTRPVQFSAYIHVDHLEHFLGTFAMSVARNGLDL